MFVKDHRGEHPVHFDGVDLKMSPVTVGIKKQFCEWLTREMLASSAKFLDQQELKAYRNELFAAPPTWGVVPSAACATSLASVEGQMMMTRLLLNVAPSERSDEWILALLTEKGNDPTSDYLVALNLVMETADPKVKRGLDGSMVTV